MRKWHRTALNIVLLLVVAAGLGAVLLQQVRWKTGADSQKKAEQTAHFTPPDFNPPPERPEDSAEVVVQALAGLDLTALQAVNPDVSGWIYIPGTDISFPILQGPDNDYYLKHTWERAWNGGGSIFLDWRCPRDFEAFYTIIYGHHMNNGSMFSPLHEYSDPAFLQAHPSVYVTDGSRVLRYDVFSAWEASVTSAVYATGPASPEERQALLDLCASHSSTGVTPGPEDRLLTLSTCTGHGHATRWVVQGVLSQIYDLSAEHE